MKRTVLFVVSALAAGAVVAGSASVDAQVIYEPVRSQYQTPAGTHLYYGGQDPTVFALATRPFTDPALLRDGRVRVSLAPQAYSDAVPYVNLHPFGYTPDDARNAANASLPRYFRKADLLRSAIRAGGNTRIVPANAPLAAGASTPPTPTATPAERKGVILIIPTQRPAKPATPTVAAGGES